MKAIILILFLFATIGMHAQEVKPPTLKGKKVKIEKVLKKYAKDKKLYAVEYRYLKDYLRANPYDSTKVTDMLGEPAKVEYNNGQTVLVYDCIVNYEVAGFWNWQEWLYLYLDDDKRVSELKSSN